MKRVVMGWGGWAANRHHGVYGINIRREAYERCDKVAIYTHTQIKGQVGNV